MGARGPAPLPEHLKRCHRIGVWLNEGELAELELRLAAPGLASLVMHGGKNARKGLKVASEHMRARVLGRRLRLTVPEVNKGALADLGRVGSNINQIAASINAKSLDVANREVLRAVFSEIQELRDVLRGASAASSKADADEFDDDNESWVRLD
jgi:Bacterial mobilisation protein (MobC)